VVILCVDEAEAIGSLAANFLTIREPALCHEDFVLTRALGFDVVRLALSLSLLEPQPGQYAESTRTGSLRSSAGRASSAST
jgi:hypothetical protein